MATAWRPIRERINLVGGETMVTDVAHTTTHPDANRAVVSHIRAQGSALGSLFSEARSSTCIVVFDDANVWVRRPPAAAEAPDGEADAVAVTLLDRKLKEKAAKRGRNVSLPIFNSSQMVHFRLSCADGPCDRLVGAEVCTPAQ
eukprot:8883269-Pyramimonas_sp.AAC.1